MDSVAESRQIMEEIKFSILVPVYNVEKYLDECIQSVLKQTYQNFELILVDDGSKDSSGAICDRYAKLDERIQVLHKENAGALSARVSAISLAQGDYFVFLDSDDYLALNALDVLVHRIEEACADCLIFSISRFWDGQVYQEQGWNIQQDLLLIDKKRIYEIIFNDESYNSMCRKVLKSSLVEGVDYQQFYHIAYGEDLLQSLEFLKKAKSVYFIKDCLYYYRMNPQSATHTLDYNKYRVDFTVREKVLEFLQKEDVFSETEYRHYRSSCIGMLVQQIIYIARFHTSSKNKKELYRQIRESHYYQSFLKQGKVSEVAKKSHRIVFSLFKKKWYGLILFIVKTFDRIKKNK